MQLNEKQSYALSRIVDGNNIFIDGPGGVGKSVLVRKIKELFSDSTVFMAPTGIAALNIEGATFHSTFKFGFNVLGKKDHYKINPKAEELFAKDGPVKRIVIDEISMVRTDLLKAVDQQLRKIRRLNIPFGGIQVIVVGDFFQLPPVLTDKDEYAFKHENFISPFCFSDETWSGANFEHIELNKIMRQSDENMIYNLMNIRSKKNDWVKSVEFFNNVGIKNRVSVLDEDPVFLCATNKAAEVINAENYRELDGEERKFFANKSGKFMTEPTPFELCLKYGTKVIITANTNKYKNGQTGYVIGFVGNKIEVLLEDDESKVLVERHTWDEIEYSVFNGNLTRNVIGSYTQYPLKHGWAITIHKAQGQSLSNAVIDLGNGCFAPGQCYVALSRLRTLEGLALMDKIRRSDVIVAPEIVEFYENDCKGIGLGI